MATLDVHSAASVHCNCIWRASAAKDRKHPINCRKRRSLIINIVADFRRVVRHSCAWIQKSTRAAKEAGETAGKKIQTRKTRLVRAAAPPIAYSRVDPQNPWSDPRNFCKYC